MSSNELPQELLQLADAFCTQAVAQLPELESLLIIPTWQQDRPELPAAIVRSRIPGVVLATPAEQGHAAIQLARTFQLVVTSMADTVIQLDTRMHDLAMNWKALHDEPQKQQ